MNKTKVEVYRDVLRDVSENFEGAVEAALPEVFLVTCKSMK